MENQHRQSESPPVFSNRPNNDRLLAEDDITIDGTDADQDWENEKIQSLEIQLKAMNEAFLVQEKILSTEVSRGSSYSVMVDETDNHSTIPNDTPHYFPFEKLLECWRKKVFQCLVQQQISEREIQRQVKMIKQQRQENHRSLQEKDSLIISLKKRYQSIEEKSHTMELELEKLRKISNREKNENNRIKDISSNMKKVFADISSQCVAMKKKYDGNKVEDVVISIRCLDRLEEYSNRLNSMAEHIGFLGEIYRQKDIQLKNSLAAVEAERRLLDLQRIKSEKELRELRSKNSRRKEGDFENDSIQDGDCGSCGCDDDQPWVQRLGRLSTVSLSAESEALLRSIYKKIDRINCGKIPVKLFLGCVLSAYDVEDAEHSTIKHSLQNKTEYEVISDGTFTQLGSMALRALGCVEFMCLIDNLLTFSPSYEITWGELLLQLLPTVDSKAWWCDGFSSLTPHEILALKSAKLLGDLEWGVLPLMLPTDSDECVDSTLRCMLGKEHLIHSKSTEDKHLHYQIQRLSAERHYLLQRLQGMSRTLERRVEAVKSYFEDDLRKAKLRESRLLQQKDSLQESLLAVQKRYEEEKTNWGMQKVQYEQRVSLLHQDNDELLIRINNRKSEEVRILEEQLQEEKLKFERLQTEHNLLQREAGKKEVKCRALQRDILRLQSGQVKSSEEVSTLADELTSYRETIHQLKKEKEEEIQQMIDDSIKEKNELNLVILDLQRQLIVANETKNALHSDNQKLKKDLEEFKTQESSSAQDFGEYHGKRSDPGIDDRELFENLRKEMDFLRHNKPSNSVEEKQSEVLSTQTEANKMKGPNDTPMNRDIFSSHLSKLLRLAEQAIAGDD